MVPICCRSVVKDSCQHMLGKRITIPPGNVFRQEF